MKLGPSKGQWSLSPSGAKDGSLPEWLALRSLLKVEELVAMEERALANKEWSGGGRSRCAGSPRIHLVQTCVRKQQSKRALAPDSGRKAPRASQRCKTRAPTGTGARPPQGPSSPAGTNTYSPWGLCPFHSRPFGRRRTTDVPAHVLHAQPAGALQNAREHLRV